MRRSVHIMRGLGVGFIVAGMAVAPARGGLALKLEPEHRQILPSKPANMVIEFFNDTDYPLALGEEDQGRSPAARFHVRHDKMAGEVPMRRTGPLWNRLRLRAGESRKEIVELSEWYDVSREGRYTVRFEVEWFGQTFTTPTRLLEVVHGIEIARLSRELSGYWGRERVYSLRYWPRGGYEHLFLSVDEPDGESNYGLFALGPLVRVFKPILEVDRKGMVKVIHQSALDRYTRTILQSLPDQVQFVDQTYHLPGGEKYPVAARSEDEIADLDAVLARKTAEEAQKQPGGSFWTRPFRAVGNFFRRGGKQADSAPPVRPDADR